MSTDQMLDPSPVEGPRVLRCLVGDELVLAVSVLTEVASVERATSIEGATCLEENGHVVLAGELCPFTAPTATEAFDLLFELGARDVDVDASRLTMCSAAGVDVLVSARGRLAARGGSLSVRGAGPAVRSALDILGVPLEP